MYMKMVQDANNLTTRELQIRNAYICASNEDGWNKSKPGLGGQKMKSLYKEKTLSACKQRISLLQTWRVKKVKLT